ncbi:NAD+ synthase [Aquipuribacter nitratireducens]|uniref:Glutamine-dependent NAD(+) synthetase n=1 Tax=Aquipuribacter nitratireducens TaxID=650104 RepID=A0ABW0GLE2_9MICO
MPRLRIALAQVDTVVGDLPGNVERLRAAVREAAAADADLVAFPEMSLTGYPVEDLALRPAFVAASREAVTDLARLVADDGNGDLVVVVGYLDQDVDAAGQDPNRTGRPPLASQNCAAVLHRGEVVARYAKNHLPNYGVFDERRIFVPGTHGQRVNVRGVDVALLVCEDLWRDGGVTAQLAAAEHDPGLVLVLNASPYERGKDDVRYELCRSRAVETGCAVAYVNAVGGQDELVFDGDSMVVGADGTLVTRAPQFVEHLLVLDLDLPSGADEAGPGRLYDRVTLRAGDPRPGDARPLVPPPAPPLPECEEVYRALVLGLRAYATKNGFRSVVLGLSGGIDSALVATLAVDALGADAVHTVSLPSRYSSQHSLDDAAELARRQGTRHRVVAIADMVEPFVGGLDLTGLAEENVQSRVRGVVLMALSNAEGHLVLAPGNKSELATGYSTIYGDAVGGFAPIKDVPKTLVWRLARWRNEQATARGEVPPVPEASIEKPPSAELAPGQLDSDSLPDYELLDELVDGYVVGDLGREALVARGADAEVVDHVVRLVDRAEWKRRQYPPGPKISPKAFGRDRRLPVTTRWQERS